MLYFCKDKTFTTITLNSNKHKNITWWKAAGSLLMAFSMFVFTGYSAITTMECFTSGTKTVQLGEGDSCCKPETAPENSFLAKCCDFEKSTISFNSFKTSQDEVIIPLPVIGLATAIAHYVDPYISARQFIVSQFANAPPPSGRDILIKICRYIL